MYRVPDIIIEASRDLRKNMTSSEKEIWKYLRWTQLWTKVLQQKPIYVCTENSGQNRFVIADFYIPEHRIVVEMIEEFII
jgi:very-short-patch-repair endonuclease